MRVRLFSWVAAALFSVLFVFPASGREAKMSAGGQPGGRSDSPPISVEDLPGIESASIVNLSVVTLDSATGDTLATRCSVTDGISVARYPYTYNLHYSYLGGYFYTEGTFSVLLYDGKVTIRAGHGFEYEPVITTVDISSDTTVTVELERFCDLRQAGWYPGDVHFHLAHEPGDYSLLPEDGIFIGLAEDLAVLNCLDNHTGFTGVPDPSSTPECIIYMTEERRSGVWGHYGLLGLQRLIEPVGSNWGPLLMEYADSTHLQSGAIVVAAHPVSSYDFNQIIVWPGSGIARELPVDMAFGKVDAFEVMTYSNAGECGVETDLWYRLLNCGFKLPGCGGTDALPNFIASFPIGAYRTYVNIPDKEFGFYEWIEGVAKGRTFVTNGPLYTEFHVDDKEAGDSIAVGELSYEFPVSIRVESVWPLTMAQVVINGEVAETVYPSSDPCVIDTTLYVEVNESSWVASRVYGENSGWLPVGEYLFAHTSPVYLNLQAQRIFKPEDAEYFVRWIDCLLDIVRRRDDWPCEADSVHAGTRLIEGRDYYQTLLGVPCDADDTCETPLPTPNVEISFMPNPLSSGTVIRFRAAGLEADQPHGTLDSYVNDAGLIDIRIYDAAGRVVRRLYRGKVHSDSFERYWDGKDDRGREVASGIYFCRAVTGDIRRSEKIVVVR
ncbi:MAG: CehA/McbA family metallohydrolase [Candidatus Krumholzibacteriota bacterium]|nr:CehA/McbA family metallohydrolase [Candidatus Krumholzibacteriota bacterium]